MSSARRFTTSGKASHRLNARIPWLFGDGVGECFVFKRRVLRQPLRQLDDLERICRSRQSLRQQWVRIERNRRDQRIELLVRNFRSRLLCGCRCLLGESRDHLVGCRLWTGYGGSGHKACRTYQDKKFSRPFREYVHRPTVLQWPDQAVTVQHVMTRASWGIYSDRIPSLKCEPINPTVVDHRSVGLSGVFGSCDWGLVGGGAVDCASHGPSTAHAITRQVPFCFVHNNASTPPRLVPSRSRNSAP